jgi:hypothetical protein
MPLNFVAKAAITVAMTAANMALTMSKKIEGPRLDDLKATGADYGTPLYMVWGLRRLEVPIFWAEELREVKRRRKTKGGKYNDYSYFGSWAVALAGHEIDAVRRIWFDTHLVYDMSGTGPVTPFDFGGTIGSIDEHVAIYLGTETQEPDPRMQATVEAEFGDGSCPAYRGTAYICFKDIPLEKVGNRIPQVSVEIATGESFPSTTVERTTSGYQAFSPDFSLLLSYNVSDRSYAVMDTASRTEIMSGFLDFSHNSSSTMGYAIGNDGVIFYADNIDVYGWTLSPEGTLTQVDWDGEAATTWIIPNADGDFVQCAAQFSQQAVYGDVTVDLDDLLGANDLLTQFFFKGPDEDIWLFACEQADATPRAVFIRFGGFGMEVIETELANSHNALGCAAWSEEGQHFVVHWGTSLYTVALDGTVTGTGSAPFNSNGHRQKSAWSGKPQAAETIWLGFSEISLVDLSTVRSISPNAWGSFGYSTATVTLCDPVHHALIVDERWLYLDRPSEDGVELASICGDVAEWCGASDCDFSDLDQEVRGWSGTRGQASNLVEPLLDIFDSDIRPHDFGIEGLKRTGVATGSTLATAKFTGEPRYTVKVRQAAELPRAVIVDFADKDAEQQPNSVRADRPLDATGARGEKKIDLTTFVDEADGARQKTNRYHRRVWNERKEISLSLTAQELKLEPGDVRTLELDGEEMDARCIRVTVQADDQIATEWKYDNPSLATLDGTAGAAFDGRDEQTVTVAVLSKGFVLDIPLLSDSDEASVPQVYTMAAPFAAGAWSGAVVYQAVDGEFTEELTSVPSSSPATWGAVEEELPYANPNVWDRGSEITVTLKTGDLTGCTEAAANADPSLNMAAIGANGRWEIVQFTDATLTAPLTYTVSGFKRGRRGTEWAAELHGAGDAFVLLETADPQAMGLSEVGTDVEFKAITAGRTSGFGFGYSYQGQTLMPYAPCHLEAVKESNGDWTLSWVRRTRIGGAWTSGTTIPLGEASEEYSLTLGDGVDDDTVTVTSPTYVWSLADQTTLTGGEVLAGDLVWSVAQVSDAVGAGFLAEATA